MLLQRKSSVKAAFGPACTSIPRKPLRMLSQSCPKTTGFGAPTLVRWLLFNLLLAVAGPLVGQSLANADIPDLPAPPYTIQRVVIDPGHGGNDAGCSGTHSKEKHIALGIAKYLRQYFQQNYPTLDVIMTRERDRFVTVERRAEIANSRQADLFISLHCNAMEKAEHIRGSETYVFGISEDETTLNVEERENAVIKLEDNYRSRYGFDPESPEGYIMLSMYQHAYQAQSLQFADLIERRMHRVPNHRSRGVKKAAFVVLREATMPSVLVETGFLTNLTDEQLLLEPEGQRLIALAVFNAFVDYKMRVENQTERPSLIEIPGTPSPVVPAPAVVATPAPVVSAPIPAPAAPSSDPVRVLAVEFCVQLAASKREIPTNTGKWSRLTYPFEVRPEGGMLKYQVTQLATFAEAKAVQRALAAEGFEGTWIVAYHNGEKITALEGKALVGE